MLFPLAHATHPQWRMAAALVLAQLRAQLAMPGANACPSLALLYITDHYADEAEDILAHFSAELPEVSDWAGTVGIGLAVTGVEYFDEPALAVMLCDVPADQYRVYSGIAPLPMNFAAHTALIHVDPRSPDLSELVNEMADRTHSGYLFGGLSASRGTNVQFALSGDGTIRGQGQTKGVFHGGLSGVAFAQGVPLISRVTQGCSPVGKSHTVTESDRNVVYRLDGEPALQVLLGELDVDLEHPEEAVRAVRATLAGLMNAEDLAHDHEGVIHRTGDFGADVRVRHIIGLDPQRGGVALADVVEEGMQLAFCQRSLQAARADLMRICAEIREEIAPAEETVTSTLGALTASEADPVPPRSRHIAGAIYVSCSGRGGPHFGAPSAELQLLRHALGDVPLIGFFAGGEIARRHIYGYTGVLTVFLAE